MRTQTAYFLPDRQTPCVFPHTRSDLPEAISELQLKGRHPVIVLVGGEIDKIHAAVTQQALQTISRIAQDMGTVVICGGTNMGIMSEIGHTRSLNHHNYPLVGIAPEELVTWPGGPKSTNFLWWGKERQQLEAQYSHFILVPGANFGDESPWIFDTATLLSQEHQAVTILINGGEVSRRDIDLSLEKCRPVIVLSRTGHLADQLASQPVRSELITVVPANSEPQIVKAIQAALSVHEEKPVAPNVDQGQANSTRQPITFPGR
jgi:predicted Rossmann-fold nucleotide-binding protein